MTTTPMTTPMMKSVLLILLVIVGGITAVVAETQDNDGKAVASSPQSGENHPSEWNGEQSESVLKKLGENRKILGALSLHRRDRTKRGWRYEWRGTAQVSGWLIVHAAAAPTPQGAAKLLQTYKMMDNSGGLVPIGGSADEGFLCKSELSDTCWIILRRTNVFVHVTAPSVRLAKDVAEWICDEIDPK